jgi:hypothetical protein
MTLHCICVFLVTLGSCFIERFLEDIIDHFYLVQTFVVFVFFWHRFGI